MYIVGGVWGVVLEPPLLEFPGSSHETDRGEGEERGDRESKLAPSWSHMQYSTYFLDVLVLCWMSVQEEMLLTSTVGIAAIANPIC